MDLSQETVTILTDKQSVREAGRQAGRQTNRHTDLLLFGIRAHSLMVLL